MSDQKSQVQPIVLDDDSLNVLGLASEEELPPGHMLGDDGPLRIDFEKPKNQEPIKFLAPEPKDTADIEVIDTPDLQFNESDMVIESLSADGHHMREEIHKNGNYEKIVITSDDDKTVTSKAHEAIDEASGGSVVSIGKVLKPSSEIEETVEIKFANNSEQTGPVLDINHIMEHADRIKEKAMWKLEQNLAGPLNSMFGE